MRFLKEKFSNRLFLLIPYLILAIFFIILPIIFLLVKSIEPIGINFDNWAIIKETSTWIIMFRSIGIGILVAFISLIIGLPFSYIVARSHSKIFKIYILILLLAPLFIFTLAKILGIKAIFTYILGDENSPALMKSWLVVFGLTYLFLPFMILPLYSIFSNMPESLIESSYDLGYGKTMTFIKIIIPYAFKAIISGIALVFMLSATNIAVSDKLLVSKSNFPLIGNKINEFSHPQSPFDIAQASSLSIITAIIMIFIYAIIILIPKIILKIRGVNHEQ